jgi:hypothetical protein
LAKHDLHLSALSISPGTCQELERIGFFRDEFANNRYCVASAYHGSYAGPGNIPDDRFWDLLKTLLLSDLSFAGHLEEERTIRREIVRTGRKPGHSIGAILPFHMQPVPDGAHKACDIHLGMELDLSSRESLETLESLKMVSFDKHGTVGVRRIYSLTCENDDDGLALFDALLGIVTSLSGFVGKIKLESITRYLRHPSNADGLPIVTSESARDWLATAFSSLSEVATG